MFGLMWVDPNTGIRYAIQDVATVPDFAYDDEGNLLHSKDDNSAAYQFVISETGELMYDSGANMYLYIDNLQLIH